MFKLVYEHINGGIEGDLEIMTIVQQKARQWAKARMHVANHIIAHCNLLISNKNHKGKEVGCQEGLIGKGKTHHKHDKPIRKVRTSFEQDQLSRGTKAS